MWARGHLMQMITANGFRERVRRGTGGEGIRRELQRGKPSSSCAAPSDYKVEHNIRAEKSYIVFSSSTRARFSNHIQPICTPRRPPPRTGRHSVRRLLERAHLLLSIQTFWKASPPLSHALVRRAPEKFTVVVFYSGIGEKKNIFLKAEPATAF